MMSLASVQNMYNLASRQSEDVLDHCAENGIAFIPWYPLAAGKLATQGSVLHQIADRLGATTAQVALAWVLERSPVMLPIPGTSQVAHLEENVAAAGLALTTKDFAELDRVGREESEKKKKKRWPKSVRSISSDARAVNSGRDARLKSGPYLRAMRARGTSQEDYLLRLIRQAAEALRRLRHRLTGGGDAPEIVRMDAVAATEVLLGSQAAVLGLIDPQSAVRLVGHPEVVALWIALVDMEAGALDAMGDGATAARRRARAQALRDAAAELWDAPGDVADSTES